MWETSLLLQDPALGMGPHVMVACPCSTVTLCVPLPALQTSHQTETIVTEKTLAVHGLAALSAAELEPWLVDFSSGTVVDLLLLWLSKDGMGWNRFPGLCSEHQSPLEQEVENFPTSFFLHHIIWSRYLDFYDWIGSNHIFGAYHVVDLFPWKSWVLPRTKDPHLQQNKGFGVIFTLSFLDKMAVKSCIEARQTVLVQ